MIKSTLLFILIGVPSCLSFSQNNSVGIGTLTPAPSALLDINASPGNDKGILIPRLTAAQRLAISNPSNSLLVFDTDSSCFFFWNAAGSFWKSLCSNAVPGLTGSTGTTGSTGATGNTGLMGPTGSDLNTHWTITGNAGTIPGINFIGTTDANDLVVSTNSSEKMRITSAGNIGINTNNPVTKLDIQGTVKIADGTQGSGKVLTSDANGLASWQSGYLVSGQATANTPLSTTSSGWVDMVPLSVTLTTSGGNLLLSLTTQAAVAGPGQLVGFRFTIDGTPVTSSTYGNAMLQGQIGTSTYYQQNIAAIWLATGIPAGSHTVQVQWIVSAGATAIAPENIGEDSDRTLVVVEIK